MKLSTTLVALLGVISAMKCPEPFITKCQRFLDSKCTWYAEMYGQPQTSDVDKLALGNDMNSFIAPMMNKCGPTPV